MIDLPEEVNTIYLSAPMRGMPQENRALFTEKQNEYTDNGYITITPLDAAETVHISSNTVDVPLSAYMVQDMLEISCSDAVVVLSHQWRQSLGVKAEIAFAESIGKPVYFEDGTLPVLPSNKLPSVCPHFDKPYSCDCWVYLD